IGISDQSSVIDLHNQLSLRAVTWQDRELQEGGVHEPVKKSHMVADTYRLPRILGCCDLLRVVVLAYLALREAFFLIVAAIGLGRLHTLTIGQADTKSYRWAAH
ncbi:hypothetical protein ACXQGN_001126, partial [Serratia marcescens]